MSTSTLDAWMKDVLDEVIAWRRHLHRNPGLSFQEEHTFPMPSPSCPLIVAIAR
jgi:metal-dependent amidase/aminoacylase/carboxypeptidase family protein